MPSESEQIQHDLKALEREAHRLDLEALEHQTHDRLGHTVEGARNLVKAGFDAGLRLGLEVALEVVDGHGHDEAAELLRQQMEGS